MKWMLTYSSWVWGRLQTPVLLVLIGLFSAITSYVMSFASTLSEEMKLHLSRSEGFMIWVIYAIWSVLLVLLSLTVTLVFCPQAAGGGIVDMKVILSGHVSRGPPVLSRQLIPTKVIGVMLALASGLSVGKEGPVVQVSAAFASALMDCGNLFTRVRGCQAKRLEILACACAAGVSSTFGAAYGGVLYSIEVLCINSSSHNIPKAYLCSICSMLTFFWLGTRSHLTLYTRAKNSEKVSPEELEHDVSRTFKGDEIVLCVLLGIVCGIVGSLFVTLLHFVLAARNYLLRSSLSQEVRVFRQYVMVVAVALLISPLVYLEQGFGAHSSHNHRDPLLDVVFRFQPIELSSRLLVFFPIKFVMTILCISLPLPVGIFDPIFLLGGVFGRIVGTLLVQYPAIAPAVSPREFSLIGAAAFSTGVTRAVSTTVIVYELSAHKHIHLPLSVAVVIAYFVGNRFSKSAYEVILESGRFKQQLVPKIPSNLQSIPIRNVIIASTRNSISTTDFVALYLGSSVQDLMDLVEVFDRSDRLQAGADTTSVSTTVPLLASRDDKLVVGSVLVQDLRRVVLFCRQEMGENENASSLKVAFEKREELGGAVITSRAELLDCRRSDERLSLSRQDFLGGYQGEGEQSRPGSFSSKAWNWVRRAAEGGVEAWDAVVEVDPSPHQVDEDLPLKKVAQLMGTLKLDQIIVTSVAQYVGAVTRSELTQFVLSSNGDSTDHCCSLQVLNGFTSYLEGVVARENKQRYTSL